MSLFAKTLAKTLVDKAAQLESPQPTASLKEIKEQIGQQMAHFSPQFTQDKDGLKVIFSNGQMAAYNPEGRKGFEAIPLAGVGSLGFFYTYDDGGFLTKVEEELSSQDGSTIQMASVEIRREDANNGKKPILDIGITDYFND